MITLERAEERLKKLERPTLVARAKAWDYFLSWRDLLKRMKIELPPPWIYADDFGAMQFEWEHGEGELDLKFELSGEISYALYGPGEGCDGITAEEDVPGLLLRLFRGEI